jgi:hypothetical protein
VHAPLGDDFAGEVGELLDKPQILQEQRAAGSGLLPAGYLSFSGSNRFWRGAFHSGQRLLRMISMKSSRTNDGSK